MTILEFLFTYAFKILNFKINVPIDFDGNYIEFKLYYFFIVIFVVEIIKTIWNSLLGGDNTDY